MIIITSKAFHKCYSYEINLNYFLNENIDKLCYLKNLTVFNFILHLIF